MVDDLADILLDMVAADGPVAVDGVDGTAEAIDADHSKSTIIVVRRHVGRQLAYRARRPIDLDLGGMNAGAADIVGGL